MIIYKDVNEAGEFTLSIAKNSKAPLYIVGVFSDLHKMNDAYEMVKTTLRLLNKKVQVIDNI